MHCSDVVGQWKAERQWRDLSSRKEQGVVEFAKMMEHQIQVNPTTMQRTCAMRQATVSPSLWRVLVSCATSRGSRSIAQRLAALSHAAVHILQGAALLKAALRRSHDSAR